jgi:hypothetical protein
VKILSGLLAGLETAPRVKDLIEQMKEQIYLFSYGMDLTAFMSFG